MSYLYEQLGKAIDDREGTVGNRRGTDERGRRTVVTPNTGRPSYTPPKPTGGKPKPAATKPSRSKDPFGVRTLKAKATPGVRRPFQTLTPAAVLTAPIVTPPPAATQAPAYGGYPSSGGGGGGSFYVPPSTEPEPESEFPEDPPAPNTEASTKPSGGMSTTTLVLIGLGLYLLTRSKS